MTQSVVSPGPDWFAQVRSSIERMWKRFDRAVLRLQGRVDTPAYDQWLPYLFFAVQSSVLIALVLARHHSMRMGTETAKYAQAVWQISEGFRPETTLADGNVIAEQGSLILYPVSVLADLFPRTETLLVLKALALAATLIPLWRLARRHGLLGIGGTTAVSVSWCLYSAVHAMNAGDFQPAILAVPALMWAVLFGFDGRREWMIVAIAFVLACRADLGLAVAGLGVLLLLERKREVGLIALLLGFGWFLVALYALQPWLGDGGYEFLAPYAEFGASPLRVLWGIVTSPVDFIKLVFSPDNFEVIVILLAPVLFLPLTAPRFLLPAVPLYVLYIGADVRIGRLREAAQYVPISVFVFVATVFALRQSGRILVKRVRVERRVVLALLLTSLVFFVHDAPSSPYNEPWQWTERDETDLARIAAVEALPEGNLAIRASSTFLPLLSERLGVYELTTVIDDFDLDRDSVLDQAVENVDWLLFDRSAEGLDDEQLDVYRTSLIGKGWELDRNDEARIDIYRFTGVIVAPVVVPVEPE